MNRRLLKILHQLRYNRSRNIKPMLFYRNHVNITRKGGVKVNKFWELVRSSVIVQGFVTLALVGTTCYLYATSQDVPQSLLSLDSLVIGFFFGSKLEQTKARGVKK